MIQAPGKRFQIRLTGIHLDAGAGVNGDGFQRVAVEDRQHRTDFIGVVSSQTRFNGQPVGDSRKDGIEEAIQTVRVAEQTGTASLVGHLGERASAIQIDDAIPHIEKVIGQGDEIFRALR